MTMNSFASTKATQLFSKKFTDFNYNTLGKTDLLVSEIGFGAGKIDIRSPLNRDALKKALLSGINLINTSSNYTDGNSEILIGEVLAEIVNANLISRESLVVVTKVGLLQGKNYDLSQERKEENFPFPDVIEIEKGFEYCIHPEFIEDQVKRSLERLKLKTIDVYLIQEPEYYLRWAKNKNIDKKNAENKLYAQIKKTFEYLEKEVQKGRIKHYGISSNTFTKDNDNYDYISLEKIFAIANEISPYNHFDVIEFPMNLFEKEAVLKTNQSNNISLLDLAEKKNLGVLIGRPLNVKFNNKSLKLAKPIIPAVPTKEIIDSELIAIGKLEKLIVKKLTPLGDEEILSEIKNNLFIFEELNNNWQDFEDTFDWKNKLNNYFLPKFHYYKNYIKNNSLKNEDLEMDLYSCTFKVGKLFSLVSAYWENEYSKFTDKIHAELADSVPEFDKTTKLSNMAIRALRSTKGVTSVLVGMTKVPYVYDAINELKHPVNKDFDWSKIFISVD
ncbi:MAG: hypothetical protein A2104_02600 [Candidatus Melainabacteria bacterium GWF2_32_7]|nr:MAG: hypothetical protein A2104_02600 [Candidatus Melainabacteria bacterium GWF2_32_7]